VLNVQSGNSPQQGHIEPSTPQDMTAMGYF